MVTLFLNFKSKISWEKKFYLIALVVFDLISWQSYVQLKSKHTSTMNNSHLIEFFANKENISWDKRKEIIHKITGKIKLLSYQVTIIFMFNCMLVWEKVNSKLCLWTVYICIFWKLDVRHLCLRSWTWVNLAIFCLLDQCQTEILCSTPHTF